MIILVKDYLKGLLELVPSRDDYRGLSKQWPRELVAGLTVGIVALPLALGFGVASGAGAAAGLITAIIAGVVAAVFGGSHLQVSGPTGAMTVVLLPVISQYGLGAIALLAIFAGVIVIVMALVGLGRAVDVIPWSVVEGFTFGIGVIIAVQQLPFAIDTDAGPSDSTLMATWQALLVADWKQAIAPLALVLVVIGTSIASKRIHKALPGSLIAIVIATLIAQVAQLNVRRIGELPTGLPAPQLPELSWTLITQLAAPALAVAALAALESLLSARVADGLVPDIERTKPDRELFGQGLANIASGLFGGLPATGAIARTAVNVRAGGRTRVSVIVHALVLLLVILALSPLVSRIPLSALAGVLLLTAWRMMDFGIARRIFRTTRADRLTFLLTCGATVFLNLVTAVLLGFGVAAALSLRHMAATSSIRREYLPVTTPIGLVDFPSHDLHDSVAVFRVDGALFYGDARRFVETVSAVEGVRGVIVRLHRMRVMDASGGEALREAIHDLEHRRVKVVICGLSQAQLETALTIGAIEPDQHAPDLPGAIDLMCQALGASQIAAVTPGTVPLFAYGIFTQPQMHQRIFSRRLVGRMDSLLGYRIQMIDTPHETARATTGVSHQPAATYTGDPNDIVAGTLFEITSLELAAMDDVNSARFERVWVELTSTTSAWAFVLRT